MGILGNNDIVTPLQTYSNMGGWDYYRVTKTAAAPVSADIESISMYISTNNYSAYTYRVGIYTTAGNRVYADTVNRNYPGGIGYQWATLTLQSSASIVAGTSYYICALGKVASDYPRLRAIYIAGTTDGGSLWVSGDYFPATLDFGGLSDKTYNHVMYLTYTSGPSVKIEGITPGKLENISWPLLSDVE